MICRSDPKAPSRQDDVEIFRVGAYGCHETARPVDSRSHEHFLARRVADNHRNLFIFRPAGPGRILFDNDAVLAARAKLPHHGAPHAPGAADDVMIRKLGEFAFHSSPAEHLSEFEF